MVDSFKRQVATKINVIDLLNGEYIKKQGWEPSQLLTSYGPISRANIIAFVVLKDENNFLIDDGTGNISLRIFDQILGLEKIKVGDLVQVIGKPREWNNQRYLVIELIRKLQDNRWLTARLLEIKLLKTRVTVQQIPRKVTEIIEKDINETKGIGPYQRILAYIQTMDKGSGVDYDEIIAQINAKNCERLIQDLVEEGEIFQIGPRKLKILE